MIMWIQEQYILFEQCLASSVQLEATSEADSGKVKVY